MVQMLKNKAYTIRQKTIKMKKNMKFSMRSLILFVSLILFAVFIISVSALPPIPYNPWGTVKIDNVSAPNGLLIQAFINGTNYANTTTTGGGWYSVNIPGDDYDTSGVKEGGVSGETVNFKVNGNWTNENGTWNSGASQFNLTVTTSVPEVIDISFVGGNIDFGSLNPGTTNNPAANNGNFYVRVESTTNVNVDIYDKGQDFISGSNNITIDNMKSSLTAGGAKTSLSTLYSQLYSNQGFGDYPIYYWLTIPNGKSSGTYSSTINIKANKTSG